MRSRGGQGQGPGSCGQGMMGLLGGTGMRGAGVVQEPRLPPCGWKGGSEGLEPARPYFSHLSTELSSLESKPEEKPAELETIGYCG